MPRRKRTSPTSSTVVSDGSGRLTHQAARGDRNHTTRSGAAEATARGAASAINRAATAVARAGQTHIRARTCPIPAGAARSTAAAVCHSSRCRRLKPIRHSERRAASTAIVASNGRNVSHSATLVRRRAVDLATVATCSDSGSFGGRRASSASPGSSSGTNSSERTASVHVRGAGSTSQPSGQQDQVRGGHESPAQVVEDLPPAQDGERRGDPAAGGVADPQAEPGGDLPVAAHPAVTAADVGQVSRWRVFEQLHVAALAGAGVARLQQIVAQHGVVGEAAVEQPAEGPDVVDALADEGGLREQVLVQVRDHSGVGIEAHLAGQQPGIAALHGAAQRDADTRLEDRVATGQALAGRIERRAVQRVGGGAHQSPAGPPWQVGVGVEGDDVADRGELRDVAHDPAEAGPVLAAK